MTTPHGRQVGGDHYQHMLMQPGTFCQTNGLRAYESNVIKYACRHNKPGGKGAEDILKAIHYLQLLLSEDYGVEDEARPQAEESDQQVNLAGLPEGYEAVRWGLPKKGEAYLLSSGAILTASHDHTVSSKLIVRKVSEGVNLPVPEGYEVVRRGLPRKGDKYLKASAFTALANHAEGEEERIIVKEVDQ